MKEERFENSRLLLNAYCCITGKIILTNSFINYYNKPHLESESSSVGRASAFQAEGRRFETGLSLQIQTFHFSFPVAGWSSQVARRAHNPKVEGSNPSPATNIK